MQSLGVDVVVAGTYERDGMLVTRVRKMRDPWLEVKRMLATGLTPID